MPDGAATAERPSDVLTVKDYRSDQKPVWCPGCGDFGVLSATFKALAALQLPKHQVVVVSGIGCSSRAPYFMSTFGFHGVHGRALPIATGIKLTRPDLTVLVLGGDGDLMAIGMGHLPHAAARNIDVTCVMMDNQTYGLTKAQASPTSFMGHKTKSTPYGVIAKPMNPVLMALAAGATFVARGYSARPNELAQLIVEGIKHKGFSFIHVHSPCAEFYNTYDFYDQRVTEMPEGWDTRDLKAAMELALTEDRVHLGIFYREERPVYELQVRELETRREEFDLARFLQERFS
ncbi:2-oxoglutarate oxidoreductase subunit KorB [bacterium HR24]|jgi:2-oxoglutarate ferredoxin oxidoreductase subunit beta|nr:2-oxoglutarate oxidoreductase subunit KorB [bacterium HR24]